MADFCKECSIANFGQDFRDLAGLVPEDILATGIQAVAIVLCECCGPISVDNEGKRTTEVFDKHCSCALLLGKRHAVKAED